MDRLVRDIAWNVLLWLPVKDLMRCKCVCKLWFDIITDPQFISNYYLFFNTHSTEKQLLLIRTPNYSLASKETQISNVSWNENEPEGFVSERIINHPYPYLHNTGSSSFSYGVDPVVLRRERHRHIRKTFPFGFWMDIMGPCNGIYFLRGNPYVMMNPSLTQFRALPQSNFTAPQGTYTFPQYSRTHFPRFGFDPQTNDYKVVVIKKLYFKKKEEEKYWPKTCKNGSWAVELYSLNSNAWRNLGADAIPFPFKTADTNRIFPYVNNCCHWMGRVYKSASEIESVVLSFNMVDDTFRKIKVPETTPDSFKRCIKNLVPCSESTTIGVLYYYFVDFVEQGTEESLCFDVWMLKDYWDDESWIKRYNVSPTPVVYKELIGYFGSNQSLWRETNGKLVLYGLDSEERKDILVCGVREITSGVQYMESLVSLQRGVGF